MFSVFFYLTGGGVLGATAVATCGWISELRRPSGRTYSQVKVLALMTITVALAWGWFLTYFFLVK